MYTEILFKHYDPNRNELIFYHLLNFHETYDPTVSLSHLVYLIGPVGIGFGFGVGLFILGVEFELDFKPVDATAVSLLKPTSEKNLLTFP